MFGMHSLRKSSAKKVGARSARRTRRPLVEQLEYRCLLASVPLTLTFTHLHQVGQPDEGDDGDYFVRITVQDSVMPSPALLNNAGFPIEDDDFSPYQVDPAHWIFTLPVDDGGLVRVTINLFDDDRAATGGDDVLDINPTPGIKGITLFVDPLTGSYSGDVVAPAFSTQGNGDGFITKLDFDVFVPGVSETIDSDGDGIADTWERRGIDWNRDGTMDLILPGANPFHKDLYVEVDAMTGVVPQLAALNNVIAAFNAVPNDLVRNPDLQPGISLHLENGGVDESTIPNANWTALDVNGWPIGFDAIKANLSPTIAGGFGTVAQRGNLANVGNILAAKGQVYRYCIFGNRYGPIVGSGSSGISELPGDDFTVTLGGFSLAAGSARERDVQAGTFMHELGHTLGLGHGGEVAARLGSLVANSATITNIDTSNLVTGLTVRGDGIANWLPGMRANLTVGNTTVTGVTTRDNVGNQVLFPGMLVYGTAPQIGPITGTLTATSNTVTGIANTALLTIGQLVSGIGIPFGTTITNVVPSTPTVPGTITLSNAAIGGGTQILTFPTAAILTVTPAPGTTGSIVLTTPVQAFAQLNGTLTAGNNVITLASTNGLFAGMLVTGIGGSIPPGTIITSVLNTTQIRLSATAGPNATQLLTFSPSTMFFTSTFITGVDNATGQVTLNQPATTPLPAPNPTLFFSDDINYKPNYHSVMNYEWQFPGGGGNLVGQPPAFSASWTATGLNYSLGPMPTIDETQLNETTPLGGNGTVTVGVVLAQNPAPGAPAGQLIFQQYVLENSAVNWDNDGTPNETSLPPLDINFDGQNTVLQGFEDWSKIVYDFRLNARDSADGGHASANPEDYTAPESVLGIGNPQFPAGVPAFVSGATPFSLFATDDNSGVRSISFRFYPQGTAAPSFTTVPDASVRFVLSGADGPYQVDWTATDNAGNGGTVHTLVITLDNTAPVSTIIQPAATEYAHSDFLTLDYTVSDGAGSGVSSFTPTLNGATTLAGHGLASGQVIHLLTELPVGTHTFEIEAADNLQNTGTTTVTFEVIVTPESIKEDVRYFLSVGQIKNHGLANSLLAKLNAAANAIARDQCPTAINIYGAFINQLNAQSGKGVDAVAAAIMIADAEYLIEHCDRFAPQAASAAPGSPAAVRDANWWRMNPAAWSVSTLTLGGYAYSQHELRDILESNPQPDARISLAQELIAAKLNAGAGADSAAIQAIIDEADSLLAGLGKINKGGGNDRVNPSSEPGELMLDVAELLGMWNEGV